MRKKFLATVLSLTLAVSMLAGCGSSKKDYENDIELLRAADIGYAVGDAQDSVKAVADRITVPCAEHALTKIIDEIKG